MSGAGEGDDDRRRFWTSLPGVLTGVAAVITALVGAAALVLSQLDRSPHESSQSPAVDVAAPSHSGDAPQEPDTSTESPSSPDRADEANRRATAVAGVTTVYEVGVDEIVDLDAGIIGSGVRDGELTWDPDLIYLLTGDAADVVGSVDRAACDVALSARSDSGWNTDEGIDECILTNDGHVFYVHTDPERGSGSLTFDVTAFD